MEVVGGGDRDMIPCIRIMLYKGQNIRILKSTFCIPLETVVVLTLFKHCFEELKKIV